MKTVHKRNESLRRENMKESFDVTSSCKTRVCIQRTVVVIVVDTRFADKGWYGGGETRRRRKRAFRRTRVKNVLIVLVVNWIVQTIGGTVGREAGRGENVNTAFRDRVGGKEQRTIPSRAYSVRNNIRNGDAAKSTHRWRVSTVFPVFVRECV